MESVYFCIQLLILAIFTLSLLLYYKNSDVSHAISFAVFFSWYLGFMGMILLPKDLYISSHSEDHFINMVYTWQAVYWMTFLMSWVVLPILIEYCESGEIEYLTRVKKSMKYVCRNWIMLTTGIIFVCIYLVIVDHLRLSGISGFLMAASNTYGLLCIIALLGYGIVNVPRQLWYNSSNENCLRRIYFKAVQAHEDRVEALFVQEEVVSDVKKLVDQEYRTGLMNRSDNTHLKYLKEVIKVAGIYDLEFFTWPLEKKSDVAQNIDLPETSEIIKLNRRAKQSRNDLKRCEQNWNLLCLRAEDYEHLIMESNDIPKYMQCDQDGYLSLIKNEAAQVHWYFKRRVFPKLFTLISGICCLFSLLIVWSELSLSIKVNTSPVGLILQILSKFGIGIEIIGFIMLFYMGMCSYLSLFTLKIFGKYRLIGNQNSTDLSLLKNAVYQCRLQFSLSYNFLLLLNYSSLSHNTAFSRLFQNMSIVHFFGTDFSVYAPIFMIILALFTLWNGYARLIKYLGLEQYEDLIPGNYEHEAKIKQGEVLVRRGLERGIRRKKKVLIQSSQQPQGKALLLDSYP